MINIGFQNANLNIDKYNLEDNIKIDENIEITKNRIINLKSIYKTENEKEVKKQQIYIGTFVHSLHNLKITI